MPHTAEIEQLDAHYQSMPPVALMQLSIAGYDGRRLQLHAPLSVHVNDKGCAFGGSLASMMTLASWGVVSLLVERAGLHADIFVADSQIRYLAPLFADLDVSRRAGRTTPTRRNSSTPCATAAAHASAWWPARLPDGKIATDFTARYVAILK